MVLYFKKNIFSIIVFLYHSALLQSCDLMLEMKSLLCGFILKLFSASWRGHKVLQHLCIRWRQNSFQTLWDRDEGLHVQYKVSNINIIIIIVCEIMQEKEKGFKCILKRLKLINRSTDWKEILLNIFNEWIQAWRSTED